MILTIFYSGMSPLVLVILILVVLSQLPIRGELNKQDVEKLNVPLVTFCSIHHAQVYVVLQVHEDGLFVKRCTPQGKAFYAHAKGAHYHHDRHHGPGTWISCMIAQGEGFWTPHQTSIKHVRQNEMFHVLVNENKEVTLVPVRPEEQVFHKKVETW